MCSWQASLKGCHLWGMKRCSSSMMEIESPSFSSYSAQSSERSTSSQCCPLGLSTRKPSCNRTHCNHYRCSTSNEACATAASKGG